MPTKPKWFYDEFQHIGVDFADIEQVEQYDRNQGTTTQDEQQLIERLGIQTQHRLIEIGCGTGTFARAAAQQCQQVYAVDVSQVMLEYARKKAEQDNITNIQFIHGGFLSYEHAEAPVDFVITKFAFHHLPDFWKMVALQRMAAMLKAEGILYLRDVIFSFPPDEYQTAIDNWIERVARPAGTGFTRSDFEMHVRNEYSTFSWIIEGLLTRAGFEITHSQQSTPEYAEYIAVKKDL